MEIVIVNQYAQPPDRPGGSRHHVFGRELTAKGHRVTIVAAAFSHLTRSEGSPRPPTEIVDGVRYVWIQALPSNRNDLRRLLGMLDFAVRVAAGDRTRRLRPNVVIGSSPTPFAALGALRLARRARVPFVLEVRDIWPDSLIDVIGVQPRHPLVRFLRSVERYLYRSAARTVSLLPDAAEVLEDRGAKRGSVVWLPNGVDAHEVGAYEPPPTSGAFTVMYAGAHGHANGLDSLVDAARALQSRRHASKRRAIQLVLVGDGPEKRQLVQRVAREQIDGISFREAVARSDLYATLREAHAFVLPLVQADVFRYGVSPNKLYDYMAMGRPIIFAVDSANDPVGEVGAGLTVPAEDPDAIAAAIDRLAEMSTDQRESMGLRGRSFVMSEHDLSILASRLEEVLQGATHPPDVPAP
jgi:glycosyltransferase involved in cell wall biosynthesis